jgi:hypothetical protein
MELLQRRNEILFVKIHSDNHYTLMVVRIGLDRRMVVLTINQVFG